MKISYKNLVLLILIFAAVSFAAHASLSDIFNSQSLNNLPDLYNNNQQLIDFLFFSLLFISIYLIGVRYAFRQTGKPEKTIAVLLGLLTSFLLVMNGYSINMLVDYVNWVFIFLLFAVIWFLLKGIKSKFWRFVVALILTIAIIILVFGYLNNIDVQGVGTTV